MFCAVSQFSGRLAIIDARYAITHTFLAITDIAIADISFSALDTPQRSFCEFLSQRHRHCSIFSDMRHCSRRYSILETAAISQLSTAADTAEAPYSRCLI
jgi:hypothetical protein